MTDYLQHMRECEARFWLAKTGGKREEVDALIARIAKRRGQAAADNLLTEMRAQHRAMRNA